MSYFQCSRCDLNIGEQIEHRYIVEKNLGEGSFGIVFKVKDNTTLETYALKLLKLWTITPEDREKLIRRFDQEYETGRIKSDFLVQSYNKGSVMGNPFILMEFCPGGDLLHKAESGNIDMIKLCHEVLSGLKALHKNGKVHRDLKPENVLIKGNGTAVLTDFGIAGDRNKRMTERGISGVPKEIFGTYAYMPPEQINPKRGDATVLPTTDIFSFGVMLFQILTHRMPFGPLNDEKDLYNYVLNGKQGKWDRNVVKELKDGDLWLRIIEGCLEPNFKNRLQNTDSVINLLPPLENTSDLNASFESFKKINSGIALHIMQGEEFGKIYKLNSIFKQTGRKVFTIGRNDGETNNTISIKETESHYISRKHCTLEYDESNDRWLLRDGQWDSKSIYKWKSSTNGTYLDSQEVSTDGIQINPGNIISIGDVKIRVEGY